MFGELKNIFASIFSLDSIELLMNQHTKNRQKNQLIQHEHQRQHGHIAARQWRKANTHQTQSHTKKRRNKAHTEIQNE